MPSYVVFYTCPEGREKVLIGEYLSMEMYKTIPQAFEIFEAANPDRHYAVMDTMSDWTYEGTAEEVMAALIAYDFMKDGECSPCPKDEQDVECWALVEIQVNATMSKPHYFWEFKAINIMNALLKKAGMNV